MNAIKDEGSRMLDRAHHLINDGNVIPGLELLLFGLWRLRSSFPAETWKSFAHGPCREHPLCEFTHQSIVTRRAFTKPCGYPGDAETIDHIYGHAVPQDCPDPRAVAINQWVFQSESCQSVRERRDILTRYIDDIGQRVPQARMLSLACGHLREAQQASAVRDGAVSAFYALDHDPRSLQLLEREHPLHVVKPIHANLNAVMRGKVTFEDMDFVYGAGIFDYLGDSFATALTSLMFTMLKPRGVLLIANFAHNLTDTGYMEAFMDWNLIYRDEVQMEQLASAIPTTSGASIRTFRDSNRNLVFLEIRRGA